jgi:hypothetical protein
MDLDTQSEFAEHIVLFRKKCLATVPQYNGYKFIVCIVLRLCLQIVLLISINHYISTHNIQTHIILKKYVSIKPNQNH